MKSKIIPFLLYIILIYSCKNNCKIISFKYENGNIKKTFTLCNGKKEGIEKKYYKNGLIKSLIKWENGKLDGKSKFFFKNGNLKQELIYKAGKIEVFLKNYYTNGNIKEIYLMENDSANGPYFKYYSDGKIMETGRFNNWEAVGSFHFYDSTGSIMQIKNYITINNNSILNEWKSFDRDSNIIGPESSFINTIFFKNHKLNIELISGDNFADLIIGKFDKNFNIIDSLSIDTIFNNKMSLEIKLKDQYIISNNYIRGIVRAVKIYEDSTLSVRKIFYTDTIPKPITF
jgi:hypothetical protein